MGLIVKAYGHDLGGKHRRQNLYVFQLPRGQAFFNPERFIGKGQSQYVPSLDRENPLTLYYSRKVLVVNDEPDKSHLFPFLPAMAFILSLRAFIFMKPPPPAVASSTNFCNASLSGEYQ